MMYEPCLDPDLKKPIIKSHFWEQLQKPNMDKALVFVKELLFNNSSVIM